MWCAGCRRSVLVAFSCRGRRFCPSCEKKKQLLWAEWLREEVLLGAAHRHVVLTIPASCAEAVKEMLRHASDEGDSRPGIAVPVATAGDLLQGTRTHSCSRALHHRVRPLARIDHADGPAARRLPPIDARHGYTCALPDVHGRLPGRSLAILGSKFSRPVSGTATVSSCLIPSSPWT
jgi:hypothetical protein